MIFKNFTDHLRAHMERAQSLASSESHQQLTSLHLLNIFLADRHGVAFKIIDEICGKGAVLEVSTGEAIKKLPKVDGNGAGQVFISSELNTVIQEASQLAKKNGDAFISTEIVLLSMATFNRSSALPLLKKFNIIPSKLKIAIANRRKGRKAESSRAEETYEALKKYARNLTEEASEGKLDPVIGRDEEIRRTIQVLSRRTNTNPF